jgi:hypothetical protein
VIEHFVAVFFQVLSNPQLLLLLVLWFFIARFIGRLTVRLSWWKIILGLLIFPAIFPELLSLSPALILIFFAGILSNHTRLILDVFAWSQSLGDMVYAFRYRSAFEDIRRREEELEARERAFRAEQARRQHEQGKESESQTRWREEAKRERAKPPPPGGGRGEDSRASQQKTAKPETPKTAPPPNDIRAQHLKTLGLDPRKSYAKTELKTAFRKATMKAHPDTGGSSEAMRQVLAAYDWLLKNS